MRMADVAHDHPDLSLSHRHLDGETPHTHDASGAWALLSPGLPAAYLYSRYGLDQARPATVLERLGDLVDDYRLTRLVWALLLVAIIYIAAHVLAASIICPSIAKAAEPSQRCDSCKIEAAPTPRPTPIVVGLPPATPTPSVTETGIRPVTLPDTDTE